MNLFKHHIIYLKVLILSFLFFGKNLLANPLLITTYPVDNANDVSPLLESIELTFDTAIPLFLRKDGEMIVILWRRKLPHLRSEGP